MKEKNIIGGQKSQEEVQNFSLTNEGQSSKKKKDMLQLSEQKKNKNKTE